MISKWALIPTWVPTLTTVKEDLKMSVTVTCRCPLCGAVSFVSCDEQAWDQYEHGALAQDAFADLSIWERESIISGMCEHCQIQFFEVEDLDDCSGECDICADFDCPSNASYFTPQE